MGVKESLDKMFGGTREPGSKAKSLISMDGDSIDERNFEVGAAPFIDGEDRDLEVTVPRKGTDPFTAGFDPIMEENKRSDLESPLVTRNRRDDMTKLLDPLRDAAGPGISQLSRFGLPNVGGMDESQIRNMLRKILRKITP